MRCLSKKVLALPLFFIIFMLIPYVEASPYYITRSNIYFPSRSGSYINFNSSLLPLSFTTLYKDGNTRWHFSNYWIRTTVNFTIQQWPLVIDRWINYSVSGAGTQEIYAVLTFYQLKVLFDGVEQSSGFSHENSITSITTTGSANVSLWFSPTGTGPPIPTPQPEEPEPELPYEVVPPEEPPGGYVGPEINPVLALCVFFAVVIVIVSAYHESPSLKSSRKKFRKNRKEKKKPKWKKDDPWEL